MVSILGPDLVSELWSAVGHVFMRKVLFNVCVGGGAAAIPDTPVGSLS